MSRRKKILIVAGTVLGAAILIPVIRHYQLRFAVANYVAELKAKGCLLYTSRNQSRRCARPVAHHQFIAGKNYRIRRTAKTRFVLREMSAPCLLYTSRCV